MSDTRPAEVKPTDAPRRPGVAFAIVAATQLMLILAIAIVIVPITELAERLSYSRADIAIVASGYGLVFSGLLLFGSRVADVLGHRRALLIGMGVFTVASLIGAAAAGFPMIVAGRLLQGVGASLAAPSALALIGAIHTNPQRRGRAFAAFGVMGSIGGIGGILAAGVIATWADWRWSFIIPAIVGAVVVVAGARWLPRTAPAKRGRLDLAGALLATFGLLLFGGALTRLEESPTMAISVGSVGVVLLAVFVMVERKALDPLLPLSFLRSRRRVAAWAALVAVTAGNAVPSFLLSLYFQQILDYPPGRVSLMFLPFALVALTGLFTGRLIDRFGVGAVTAAGLVTAAVGNGLIATLDVDAAMLPVVLIGMCILPFGIGMTFSGATVAAMADVSPDQASLAGGIVNTAIEVGGSGGTAASTATAAVLIGVGAASGATQGETSASAYGGTLAIMAALLVVVGIVVAYQLRRPSTSG